MIRTLSRARRPAPSLPPRGLAGLLTVLVLGACTAPGSSHPTFGGRAADELIQPGERHFAHLWQLTDGGENAEGYFSFSGDRLVFQHRNESQGIDCDRIYVLGRGQAPRQVSSGHGTTTCSYFLPGDRAVVFASTQAQMDGCPPAPDRSDGYVWPIHPEFDVWRHDLETGAERRLTDSPGYDAEATVSPRGDRIVFTSERSGDLELWTCDLEGGDLRQVTDELGYDGGAFFSHDGKRLVFRATRFVEPGADGSLTGTREQYVELLGKHKIRPHKLDLYVIDVDGRNRRRVTDLGGASWAPYFFPDDQRIIFSSNHHDPRPVKVEFDLFAVPVEGGDCEQITTYEGFDAFPQFSPDGRWLVFASNRGQAAAGETNLFLAEWRD